MCQFPDFKDILNELEQDADSVEYAELARFLPNDTSNLYDIVDPEAVLSVSLIRAQNTGFAKNLFGDLFNGLNRDMLISSSQLRVEASTIRIRRWGRSVRVMGVSLFYKPNLFPDDRGPIEIHLALRDGWEDTWMAVEHDKFPDPNDVTANEPMRLLSANDLRAICSPLIPREHHPRVIAALANQYGWRRAVPAGNQVCLIG
ncbi:hypothetical protein pEaSNUABM6_00189 [Erwinia phage pEa_SNUABM_6]|nr:hypothetical protein pEaSNUABM6_00189 [Erwinia phage pEa_SNUABM_6]